jgi:hypothetical protein
MAHYAYLDDNNKVVTITVGKDETEMIDGMDTETYYAKGTPYRVKRTSYNGNIRKNYAGIGYSYDELLDAFIPPKCHDQATLDESTCLWICDDEIHNPKTF